MLSWGLISCAFAFVDRLPWGPLPTWFGVSPDVFGFYALRFLLGLAEAGFFPGIILYLTYWFPSARRARTVALFMTAIAAANVVGAPLSGAIMQFLDGVGGWHGWRWLFVLEALSVTIQVASFKTTGKRVFRMAPLHHHFEKKGWAEPTIVIRFWIIAVILAVAGLSTLKIR